jgi:hypothetical protein
MHSILFILKKSEKKKEETAKVPAFCGAVDYLLISKCNV